MLSSYVTSIIRTLAALAAGWVLSLPLAHPVLVALGQADASAATKEKLVAGLTVVASGVYYAAARALERRWPSLTLLLGSTRQPTDYGTTADGTPSVTSLVQGGLGPDVDLNMGLGGISAGISSGTSSAPIATGGPIPAGLSFIGEQGPEAQVAEQVPAPAGPDTTGNHAAPPTA